MLDEASLSTIDRLLLVVPMIVALFLGLAPWLIAVPFANLMGYGGNDWFFYWLAGSAALGYGVTLAVGIREGSWRGLRSVVIAALGFNLVTLYACALEAFGGTATSFVYLVAAAALVQVAITIFLLSKHRGASFGRANIPGGPGALLLPVPWVLLVLAGVHGNPLLVATLAGAAILGAVFLLSWAAELIQMDVSQALALALLALIAVLPEYAVDAVFAYQAGRDPVVAQQGYAALLTASPIHNFRH